MRKIIGIILLFTGIAVTSYSQYYSKSFLIDNLNTLSTNISIVNNELYSIGGSPDTTLIGGIGIKSFISKFNNNGTVKDYKTYRPIQNFSFISAFSNVKSLIYNNKFISVGYTEDTGTFQRNYLVSFYDTNLLLNNYHLFPTGGDYGTLTSITFSNGYFFSIGTKQNISRTYMLKIDTSGNKIFERNYPIINSAQYNLPRTIIPIDSGDLLMSIGGYKEFMPGSRQLHLLIYKTTLIRTDSLGGQKWQWTDSSNNGQAPYSFQKTSDGGYVSCGSFVGNRVYIIDSINGNLIEDYATFHPYIVKWNSDFTKQWEKYYDKTDSSNTGGEFFDIKETQDGNFISCGYGGQTIGTTVNNGGWLQKTDRNGEVIWRRFYKPYGYDTLAYFFRLYDLDIANNGDIIAVGEYDPTSWSGLIPQQGWILRVDSNGCIVDSNWCGWNSIEVEPIPTPKPSQEGNELRIFPNPANDIINLTVKNGSLNPSDKLTISIFDVQGREVFYNKENYKEILELDISNFDSGIYFIKINTEDNNVVCNGKFVKD